MAASTILLGGCENANMYLEVTFVNNTDQDLRIHVRQGPVASVRARDTEVATIGDGADCESDVSAVVADGTLIAEKPGKLCQGDTWVIEPTDLVPADNADKTPPPSP